jgi:LmbE family N-acetylglucosaminyl deacetylase
MISLRPNELRRVLLLGAHSDDIEIGCGGTILKLLAENRAIEIVWVVFSGALERQREAKSSALAFLTRAENKRIYCYNFKDAFFPSQWAEIKEEFERLRQQLEPDLIFTHWREDRHQDHRVLSDLAWNTFRNHLILEYEVPKYDGDLGRPNVFNPLNARLAQRKARNLCRFFQTQRNRHWFAEETFLGLMRLRGVECASTSGYAEAFHCRKLVLGSPADLPKSKKGR